MVDKSLLYQIVEVCNRYNKIPLDEWERIMPLIAFRELKKGDYFVRVGDLPREVAFILKGGVRHYYIDSNGAERTTDFCVPGEFTGPVDIFEGKRRPAEQWIQAFADTGLAVFDNGELEEFVSARPAFQNLFRAVVLEYFSVKSRRETELLSSDIARRYENFLRHYPDLSRQLPQYQIASFLGITAETLSRIRSRRKKTVAS